MNYSVNEVLRKYNVKINQAINHTLHYLSRNNNIKTSKADKDVAAVVLDSKPYFMNTDSKVNNVSRFIRILLYLKYRKPTSCGKAQLII